jgi:hypothetical protein
LPHIFLFRQQLAEAVEKLFLSPFSASLVLGPGLQSNIGSPEMDGWFFPFFEPVRSRVFQQPQPRADIPSPVPSLAGPLNT